MPENLATVLAKQATLTALSAKIDTLKASESAAVTSIEAKAAPVAPVATVAPKSTLWDRLKSFFRFL